MIESVARATNCPDVASSQVAYQADGSNRLDVVGEAHVTLTHDDLPFTFSGLNVHDLDVGVLAGVPFMEENNIAVRPTKKLITVGRLTQKSYSSLTPSYCANNRTSVLRATCRSTVWPAEYLEVAIDVNLDGEVAIELHVSSQFTPWPGIGVHKAVGSIVRFRNDAASPIAVKENSHLGMMSKTESSKARLGGLGSTSLPREEIRCTSHTQDTTPPLVAKCPLAPSSYLGYSIHIVPSSVRITSYQQKTAMRLEHWCMI